MFGQVSEWVSTFVGRFQRREPHQCGVRTNTVDGAIFEGTNLNGANFSGVQLGGGATFGEGKTVTCTFEGATYDDGTVFPSGLDPSAHGMVKL